MKTKAHREQASTRAPRSTGALPLCADDDMQWPWLLVWCLTLQCHAWMPRPTSLNAKIQQGIERARVEYNHQISKHTRQSKAEYLAHALHTEQQSKDRIDRSGLLPEDQIIELYTRQASLGPWLFVKELLLNSTIAKSIPVSRLALGGIQGEQARLSLDRHLCLELYGAGLGTPSTIAEAQSVSKALRHLRPTAIQLGYRLADQEDDSIYILDRSKAFTLPVHRKFTNRLPLALAVDWTAALRPFATLQSASAGERQRTEGNIASFLAKSKDADAPALLTAILQVDRWISSLLSTSTGNSDKWDQVLIFIDGSAHYEGTKICQAAFAGMVALPYHSAKHTQQEKLQRGEAEEDERSIASLSSSSNQAHCAKKAFQIACTDRPNPSIFHHALCLHIDSVESFVEKPLDVETFAGISALLYARLIRIRLAWAMRSRARRSTMPFADHLDIILQSDSRSIVRQYAQLSDVAHGTESSNGKALSLQTAMDLVLPTRESGSSPSSRISVEWVAGHPEKREDRVDRWTLKECGAFLADELCRKSSQIAMARDRQRKAFEQHFQFDFRQFHSMKAHAVLRMIALLESLE